MPRARRAKPAAAPPPTHSESEDSDIDIDVSDGPPATVDPYAALGLSRASSSSITPDQIKSAYRRSALLHHPDKVPDSQKAAAHTRFQEIAFAYAILSSPARRARYDATGSTADSLLEDGDEEWSWAEYFRTQFRDAISAETIAKFAKEYVGSGEERGDILAAYTECEGDLDGVFERVMFCESEADRRRVGGIIDAAVESGEVERFKKYAGENEKARAKRAKKAKAEAGEAEEYAKELGIHDKVFGKGKGKTGKKKAGGGDEDEDVGGLAALIQARQKERNPDAFFDHLLDKYGPKGGQKGKAKGGKKRTPVVEDDGEEDEEMGEEEEAEVPRASRSRKKTKR